jgi:hypothetical protein
MSSRILQDKKEDGESDQNEECAVESYFYCSLRERLTEGYCGKIYTYNG